MELSVNPSCFFLLLISSVLGHRMTLKMRLSVLITTLKRIFAGPRKVLITLMKVLITPRSQRRCIISLNFMSTFDMIMIRERRKMCLLN